MQNISSRQLLLMGVGYTLDATLISLPSQMIAVAKQQAWLSFLVVVPVVGFVLWLLGRVNGRFPDRGLFQALTERFPIGGRVVTLLFVLFYFFILVRDLRMMVDFVDIVLLPETPILVIGFLTLFAIFPITFSGAEVMARVNEFFLPLLILAVVLLPLLIVKEFDVHSLLPMFDGGITPVLKGAWMAGPYVGEVVILPFLFSRPVFTFRTGLYSLLLGAFLLTHLLVQNLLVTGVHLTARLAYPNLELIRQVRLTDFLDRFDIMIVSLWLPSIICKISFSLFVVCYGLKCCFGKLSHRLLASPVGVFALACSFWFFKNMAQLLNLNFAWPAVGLFFQVLIPIGLFFFLRPKRGAAQEKGSEREGATRALSKQ